MSGATPRQDLPFDAPTRAWIATGLRSVGQSIDPAWFGVPTPTEAKIANDVRARALVTASSHAGLDRARRMLGPQLAHWEQAELFSLLFPAVLFDLGRIDSFGAFRFLYRRLLGEGALPWLPMLYLAGVTSASWDESLRRERLARFALDDVLDPLPPILD